MQRYGTLANFDGYIQENRIVFERSGEIVWLEPYGENAVRFRSSASLHINADLNWTLLPPEPAKACKVSITGDRGRIENGAVTAEILSDGTVTFYDRQGRVLLEELWLDKRMGTAPQRDARIYEHISSYAFKTDVYFQSNEEEHFYGLGQEANDCFDLKGCTVELFQKNTKCTIPFLLSSRGYGFLWNNPSIGRVELTCNHTRWHSEACQQVDYIVIGGDSPAQINYTFTGITGRAPALPQWAAGFWQSRLRYETQEQALDIARKYRELGVPLDVLVIDYFHWPRQGDWKFDQQYWPDVPQMCSQLEQMGVHPMVSIWPTVDPRSENHAVMKRKNYLIHPERGVDAFFMIMGPQGIVDATHPGAREFLWERAYENYYKKGIRAFWLDEAEPEMRPYSFDNVRYYLGNGLEVSNIYPFYYAKAFYDGMRQNQESVVNLVRCAWLGSQRLGVVLWSGDIPSDFDSLRCQIKAGLNVSLCGIPWWTTDIGGFFGGSGKDPKFVELLLRWFQFGAFCPIFRLHGKRLPYDTVNKQTDYDAFLPTCGENEIWSFGEEAFETMKAYILLRQRLKPYIMAQMDKAHLDGTPVMRPLLYDFYEDTAVYSIGDEYMFGPDLLVCPVAEEGARQRQVYLPKGTSWRDAWTGTEYAGGTTIQADAPLDRIPLYLRGDCDLPIRSGSSVGE
jgi:alpha-D-xyloside xylohydrolase